MQPLCAFDLDHTLIRSTLDLRAMRLDIRALAEAHGLALPAASVAWTIAQTIDAVARLAPPLGEACWAMVVDRELRALASVSSEPGAREALEALRAVGFPLAVWTNNTRAVTEQALDRCGLRGFFATVVTRDEAALKPDPAGLALLRAAFPARTVWVVGDSWVDGAAAQAGGAGFIAYGTDPAELARRAVTAHVVIDDLRALPAFLMAGAVGAPSP